MEAIRAEHSDIVPQRRIVYVYQMYLDETKISASLATVQFHPHDRRKRLLVTEQGVFLNGDRDEGSREEGTNWLMDQFAASLLARDRRVHSREITLTRVLFAPRDLVLRAWTDPQYLGCWFGPAEFTVTHCEVDARVGGKWMLIMRANDEVAALVGRDQPAGGEYREVTQPSRLVFTTSALDAAGNVILEGLTTVTFKNLGTSTRMTLHTRATGTGERVPFRLAGVDQSWDESRMKLARATVSSDPAQAHMR